MLPGYWERRMQHNIAGSPGGRGGKTDPYAVNVTRDGEFVIVTASGTFANVFYKKIRMKDRWWWNLLRPGHSWEAEVLKAQKDAFEAAYRFHRDEEMKNYSVDRLK